MAGRAWNRPYSSRPFSNRGVSGELRYLGSDLSSTRPPKPMIWPRWLDDREHDALAEPVVALAVVALDDEAGIDRRPRGIVREDGGKALPAGGCEPEAEACGDRAGESASLEVVDCPLGLAQLGFIEPGSLAAESRRGALRWGHRRLAPDRARPVRLRAP